MIKTVNISFRSKHVAYVFRFMQVKLMVVECYVETLVPLANVRMCDKQ